MPISRRSLRMCSVCRFAMTRPLNMHLSAYLQSGASRERSEGNQKRSEAIRAAARPQGSKRQPEGRARRAERARLAGDFACDELDASEAAHPEGRLHVEVGELDLDVIGGLRPRGERR